MCVLQTDRLCLHQLSTKDAPFILALLNTPGWLEFIGDRGVRNLADARNYILNGPVASYNQRGFGLYLVTLTESRLPIGLCGLLKRESLADVDIGFAFMPEYTRQGYAYEAASAVLTYARATLDLKRIVAITAPGNQRSISLLERLGLRYKAIIKLAGQTEESILYETS
ncbi:GNAT family N-acetyltransferase [Spirosoma utsteinense]|uniref:RimJ/RimL family protein N-acetyltransferase n=1 Tax=Spirosoma utsteinense TaxID=2585773 RepID=A0ABR6WCX7_9BACT|nr:GNAT family N-acetyltransferase [Spirosoma utsteinense]MBC3784205.1 RimJ/RimL family protein N-acetyltransferase [Spirosoma utsteinense]MBC3794008.1 RimJ/RimL family protein N-acetyltransferase [Spirosoma utsteinense]